MTDDDMCDLDEMERRASGSSSAGQAPRLQELRRMCEAHVDELEVLRRRRALTQPEAEALQKLRALKALRHTALVVVRRNGGGWGSSGM